MMAVFAWLNATKNAWLFVVIILGAGGVWFINSSQKNAAFQKGVEAGKGAASTAAVAAATETSEAQRTAEAETPLPADKLAIIELCRRSASCRERGQK
jgi:hypothetical protein